MLVGPSLTLAKLEGKLKDRLYEIKMEIPKLKKEFSKLGEEYDLVKRVIVDENGDEIVNPEYKAIPKRMLEVENEIKHLEEQQHFIEDKVIELSDIEERSVGRGNVDKEKYTINLTLSDCLKLGIEVDETNPEE